MMEVAKPRTAEDSPLGEWLAAIMILVSWSTLLVVLLLQR